MYPLAVQWGIASDEFWGMTYGEILVQVEANKKKREAELKEKAQFDYKMAQLITYAFNNPKKMPKPEEIYSFLKSEEEVERLSPEEQQRFEMLREQEIMAQMANSIKRTKARKNKRD